MMKSAFLKSNVKLMATILIVLLLLLKVVKRNHRVHLLLLQTAQITLKIQSWMKIIQHSLNRIWEGLVHLSMRRFSSLKYEQSVPLLYYSCIKSGYLCKYCELFQKEVFQSVHTDQALLQTFPNVYKLLYLMNIIPACTASVERNFSYMNLIKTPLSGSEVKIDPKEFGSSYENEYPWKERTNCQIVILTH